MYKLILFVTLLLFSIDTIANAYIGPGMAGGAIAATTGVIIAIFAAIFGILYYPIKRFFKNKKQKKTNEQINEQINEQK